MTKNRVPKCRKLVTPKGPVDLSYHLHLSVNIPKDPVKGKWESLLKVHDGGKKIVLTTSTVEMSFLFIVFTKNAQKAHMLQRGMNGRGLNINLSESLKCGLDVRRPE